MPNYHVHIFQGVIQWGGYLINLKVFINDTVMSENGHSGGAAVGLREMDATVRVQGTSAYSAAEFIAAVKTMPVPSRLARGRDFK